MKDLLLPASQEYYRHNFSHIIIQIVILKKKTALFSVIDKYEYIRIYNKATKLLN